MTATLIDRRGEPRTSSLPRSVVVVVFDGTPLGIMSFGFGVFDMGAHYEELAGLTVRVVAGQPDARLVGGGLSCAAPYDLAAIRSADLIIVPNWPSETEEPPADVRAALRAAHADGARIAGLGSGVFVLAAAGLLDGRPATTGWAMADLLAARYPKVRVDASVLYVDDGDILTAGGGAAGMDLCLHLIRTMCGAGLTNRLARTLAVPPHRVGGQAQYIEAPMPQLNENDPVAQSMAWALTRLDVVVPVTELARRAHMSRRNYDRRFREVTGIAPAAWLIHQRVIRAQRLLESTQMPIDEVARYCGFSSAAAMRPHFRRSVGVVPTAYREAFGTPLP